MAASGPDSAETGPSLSEARPGLAAFRIASPVTRPWIQVIGSEFQVNGPVGQVVVPAGQVTEFAGQVSGPEFQVSGPVGQVTGFAGQVIGPAGQVSGPGFQVSGPVGQVTGFVGQVSGPVGQDSGPEIQVSGPAGPLTSKLRRVTQFPGRTTSHGLAEIHNSGWIVWFRNTASSSSVSIAINATGEVCLERKCIQDRAEAIAEMYLDAFFHMYLLRERFSAEEQKHMDLLIEDTAEVTATAGRLRDGWRLPKKRDQDEAMRHLPPPWVRVDWVVIAASETYDRSLAGRSLGG
jgi:hypothetical protein